jgi:molybdenum cofactor cytidylyltransferase
MTEIAAIVLAAGRSDRMGEDNKLLMPWKDGTILGAVLDNVRQGGAGDVYLVTGYDADLLHRAIAGRDVKIIHNPDYGLGLSSSLKAGIAALPETVGAAMICLGDMPKVRAEDYRTLAKGWKPGAIAVPVKDGRRGNPVIFGREYFPEIMKLEGDRGAKPLLGKYANRVIEVECPHDGIFRDIDTPEDYGQK